METEPDPEVAAIQKMHDALAPLDEKTRERVMEWAAKKYGSATGSLAAGNRASAHVDTHRQSPTPVAGVTEENSFKHFAELYDAVDPETDADKALVGGYWMQVCQQQEFFASRDVNKLLEDQGRAISHISRAFDSLRQSKPALVHQIEKAGKTQQARKKFKLTTEGIKWVRSRLNGGAQNG